MKEKMKADDDSARIAAQGIKILEDGKYECPYCAKGVEKDYFDEHFAEHPTKIRGNIWMGSGENAQDMEFFKVQNISHVLNCTREVDCPEAINGMLKGFKRIAVLDRNAEDLSPYFGESFQYIEESLAENKDNVLFVHCREGKSRSASFLCAYLMWKEGLTFESAIAEVRSRRSVVMPNARFEEQLKQLEKKLAEDQELPEAKRKFGVPKDFVIPKLKQNE